MQIPNTAIASVLKKPFPEGKLHHIGIVTHDIQDTARSIFNNLLDLQEVTLPFDDKFQKVRVLFVRVADTVFVELIEPAVENSPVAGALKRGGGLHHIAFEVDDVEDSLKRIETKGGRIISHPTIGFEGRRIAFVYPRHVPGILIELVGPPSI